MSVKQDIIYYYRKKKFNKRRQVLQKLDGELFAEYYKIYESIRKEEYGTQRLFPNERDCIATDAFYKFSDKLEQQYLGASNKQYSNTVIKSGLLPVFGAGFLLSAQAINAVPTNAATIGLVVLLTSAAIVQNVEQRYAAKRRLNAPTKQDFVFDHILTPDFDYIKERYENMAAIKFRNENPMPVTYGFDLKM